MLPQDTVLVDFGNIVSPAPWNNLADPAAGVIASLNNTDNNLTGYGLEIVDPFNNINTAGTSDPDPAIGFPASATGDSFFGNVTEFGGQSQPTAGLRLVRLKPEKSYTITFFASRAATDNREAQYVLSGATTDTVLLDAASNTDRVVTATVFPTADSTILISVSPGPNNTNSAGFYYLGALRINYDFDEFAPPVAGTGDTLLIDFGNQLSPAPWNNVTGPATDTIADLMTALGTPSGIRLTVVDSFNNINTGGTLNPDPALGFPATATGDSFFGNVTPFGGQTQPTGAVELANLDTTVAYSFTIFASRTATDNREAQYVLTGATTDTVYLDAASNTDSVATATLFPAADGTIRLAAAPGPNNSSSAGFYYLGAIKVGYELPAPVAPFDTILVDFGNNFSPAPWNNISDAAAGEIGNLPRSDGFQSGYGLRIFDPFNNINTAGSINPDPAIGFPATATGDSFFGNVTEFGGQVQPTGGVELYNLKTDKEYSLTLFASRVASDNREAQYVVEGLTVDTLYLDAASNTDSVVTATLLPAADGTIRVTASTGPNNTNSAGFYYLGAMKVIFAAEEPAGASLLSLTAPNGGEIWQVGKTPSIVWKSENVQELILEYSVDNGENWTGIDTVAAISGAYPWTIPNTPSTESLVRIRADTLVDASDAVFEISADTTTCRIVVLGSSTAAGTGASTPDSAWVNRYARELSDNTRYEVINLARGGYTTYHILPTGTMIPGNVNITIDETRNVTQALSLEPYAIIVNMPSNDAANGFPVSAQLANFEAIVSAAEDAGTRVWVATTQPRNFGGTTQINIQRAVRDSIFARYGDMAIDFWNGLAAENGFILPEFDAGDGVHVNDAGHRLLFERVLAAGIDTIDCAGFTDVADFEIPEGPAVKLYPNPTTGQFTVELDTELRGEFRIQLIDLLGRELYRQEGRLHGGGLQRIICQPTGDSVRSQYVLCLITIQDGDRFVRRAVPLVIR